MQFYFFNIIIISIDHFCISTDFGILGNGTLNGFAGAKADNLNPQSAWIPRADRRLLVIQQATIRRFGQGKTRMFRYVYCERDGKQLHLLLRCQPALGLAAHATRR